MIHHVYKTAEGEVLPLANARAHEISMLVGSLAFRGKVDTEDILSANSWGSHSTFTDFYLRDIALLLLLSVPSCYMIFNKVLLLGVVGVFFPLLIV